MVKHQIKINLFQTAFQAHSSEGFSDANKY